MNVGCEIVHGSKFDAFAAVERIGGFLGSGAEPFELGLVFLLALFQEPEPFAHHLAGVAEAAGCDADLDEAVKVLCQVCIAGWQDGGPPPSTLAGLAIVANG